MGFVVMYGQLFLEKFKKWVRKNLQRWSFSYESYRRRLREAQVLMCTEATEFKLVDHNTYTIFISTANSIRIFGYFLLHTSLDGIKEQIII